MRRDRDGRGLPRVRVGSRRGRAAGSHPATVGPLRPSDPVSGVHLDLSVVAVGCILILLIAVVASMLAGRRLTNTGESRRARPFVLTLLSGRPTTMAGLSFANPTAGRDRRRAWSSIAFTAGAVALTAAVVTLGSSSKALVDQPKRYGFDWDLIALNAFDDQQPETLRSIFADDPDVVAATGFTSNIYELDGSLVVSGFAFTNIEGSMQPTLIAGREVRSANEVAL